MWLIGFWMTSLHLFLMLVNGTPPERKTVKLKLGGIGALGFGDPSVIVSHGANTPSEDPCNTNIPDVPQPYGELGRYIRKFFYREIN